MEVSLQKITLLGALSLLLSSCAVQQAGTGQSGQQMTPATAAANAYAIAPTSLMLSKNMSANPPKGSNIVLASEAELRGVLEGYGVVTIPNPPIGALIASIRAANMNPQSQVPGMTGLGGVFGHAFLEMASEAALLGGPFQQGSRVVTSVYGQINENGYVFNRAAGSGSLTVTTYFTRTVVPVGQGAPPPKTEAYRWQVRVDAGGFTVVPKGTDPANPFPGTLPFSPEMIQRIDSYGFTHKLWAKGTAIHVERVWYKAPNSTSFDEVFATQPKYAKLFLTDAQSCIDMLFVGEPPETYAELKGPPVYCLGRCDQPFIVNTGL